MNVVQVHPSVYRIKTPFGEGGTVFVYLIKGDSVALVDTGAYDSPQGVLQPALAQIGMSLSDVDVILTTHAHLDHSGGNSETKKASKASIYLHSAELDRARSTATMVKFGIAPMLALDFPAKMVQARAEYIARMSGEAAGADVLLSGGETVDLGAGVCLRVIHNPGHTPGSVSFFWESEGLLITGDAIQGQGWKAGTYPLYVDATAYRRSLATLSEVDYRLMCLQHAFTGGGAINDPTRDRADGMALLKESMKAADTIHAAIVEAMRQMPDAGKREIALAALSELIYEVPQLRVRASNMPTAAVTLLAHMNAAIAGTYPG